MAPKSYFFLFDLISGHPFAYVYLALLILAAIIAIYTKRGLYFALGIPIAGLITFLLGYIFNF